CRMRCEPVRWTSTLTPENLASKSLATFSAVDSASEVYQTTLPSLRAASSRASCAAAGTAAASEARRAPASRRFMDAPSRHETSRQIEHGVLLAPPRDAPKH